jgi:hypothetical protein
MFCVVTLLRDLKTHNNLILNNMKPLGTTKNKTSFLIASSHLKNN